MQKPLLNQLAPGFSLESTDDQTISPWDYKGKKGLVMLFFDPRDSRDLAVLSEIRRRYREITDASAEVLAIASGPKVELMECAEGMDLPFPLLSDLSRSISGSDESAFGHDSSVRKSRFLVVPPRNDSF